MISLPSHTWTVLLQKQEQEKQHQEQEQHSFRVTLCSIHVQTRYILANVFKNIFFFSFLWRTFLILYGEGFIRNGRINIRLFGQLFWIITIAFITIGYSVFPGKMLVRGTFSQSSAMGTCLLRPRDDQISRDNLKIIGVVFSSAFNMIIFVIYLTGKSKRLLKSKTSLIGRFRRNDIDYKESAAMAIAWSAFNILEICVSYLFRSPFAGFWADQIMWVFLFEIVSFAFTCIINFREIPYESVPSKTIPFYVTSPLVLTPRRPSEPIIPLLLPSVRSRITPVRTRISPVRSRIPPVRSRITLVRSRITLARSRITLVRSRIPSVRSRIPSVRSKIPSVRSRIPSVRSRTPPVRSRIILVRSRGKGTNKIGGSAHAVSSQHTHQRSGQHKSDLPDVQ